MTTSVYKKVVTGDGSYSLYSEEFGELMHTDAGAYEEAVVKHLNPSMILSKCGEKLSVLDVGFGMGYNPLALLTEARRMDHGSFFSIVSLEYDRTFLDELKSIRFGDDRDDIYNGLIRGFEDGYFKSDFYDIRFIYGDARLSIQRLVNESAKFDAVFQDSYSPSKNPELWSLDYFLIMKELMKDDAILTTYSAAPQIRRAMIEAGLKVGRAPSTGVKKEGSVATISAEVDYLSEEEIREIFENVKSVPYRDEKLKESRGNIFNRRIEEMRIERERRRELKSP